MQRINNIYINKKNVDNYQKIFFYKIFFIENLKNALYTFLFSHKFPIVFT
jgi:hypothetical protein